MKKLCFLFLTSFLLGNDNALDLIHQGNIGNTPVSLSYEDLLHHTISRSFAIDTIAKQIQSYFNDISLEYLNQSYTAWHNPCTSRRVVLDNATIKQLFNSTDALYLKSPHLLWIAKSMHSQKNNNETQLIGFSDTSTNNIDLSYHTAHTLDYDHITKALYFICSRFEHNKQLYKISEYSLQSQLLYEFPATQGKYLTFTSGTHLGNDQLFFVNNNFDRFCHIVDISTGKNIVTLPKNSYCTRSIIADTKKTFCLIGEKIKNCEKDCLIVYTLTDSYQAQEIKRLSFDRPVIDTQFVPGYDDKLIVVTNEPSSQRLRLFNLNSHTFLDIHTDFIRYVHFLDSHFLQFYNMSDKDTQTNATKKAIYKIDYATLFAYQMNKEYKPLTFDLTRKSSLKAKEQD